MLKYLGIIMLLLSAACNKNNDVVLQEKTVAKKIEFHVHAGQLYNQPAYRGVTADVKLAIYKINFVNGQSELLWETTYAERPLANFPNLPQKMLVEKTFDVLESKEKLQAAFTIRYHSPQGISQETRAEELVPGDNFAFLDVEI